VGADAEATMPPPCSESRSRAAESLKNQRKKKLSIEKSILETRLGVYYLDINSSNRIFFFSRITLLGLTFEAVRRARGWGRKPPGKMGCILLACKV